ncbi:uncharacterized protein LOC117639026 isoform X2 [Thrips palmi]|uniref:Uncharacterized protein LOC117639026 isoform X2 n=1 Tax=Thrips palmi TaxID=161013 RepID=A0A6P8ZGJ9_THRPL|nr:uncharacterized protein LOC117639026 isoform X2 [Thrips palmi]
MRGKHSGDVPGSRNGHLCSLLQSWQTDLAGPKGSVWQMAAFHIRRSKFLTGCTLLWLLRSFVDLLLQLEMASRHTLRHIAGVYGAMWGLLFFVLHDAEVEQCLGLLGPVATRLELAGSPATKAHLKKTAQRLQRIAWFHQAFRLLIYPSTLLTLVMGYSHSAVFKHLGECGAAYTFVLCLLEVLGMIGGIHAVYWMLPMTYAMFGSCAALFTAIGTECCQVRGRESLRTLAVLHGDVVRGARVARTAVEGYIIHILACSMMLPLIASVEVILKPQGADAFTFSTAILIIVIVIPQCLTGDALHAKRAGPGRLAAHFRLSPNLVYMAIVSQKHYLSQKQ